MQSCDVIGYMPHDIPWVGGSLLGFNHMTSLYGNAVQESHNVLLIDVHVLLS